MLASLNEIATTQEKPTARTEEECQKLQDYTATYPNVHARYCASDMILWVESDAAYLVLPKAKSRIAGYFHLSNHPKRVTHPTINGAMLIMCKALMHVVSSSAEAETAGVFMNAQQALPIRHALMSLDHPQPPTPLKTDNSTTHGFVHNNMQQKRSKSWDMRYHWLRDRETQKQIKVYWEKGQSNNADYYTKQHLTKHHLLTRKEKPHVNDR